MVAGLVWITWQVPKKQAAGLIDQALGVFLLGLAGSRLVYVLAHWDYYQAHIPDAFQIWSGGLSGIGAILGALLGISVVAVILRGSPALLADQLLRLGLCLTLAAWLGCWFTGCCYGPVIASGRGLPVIDEWGNYQIRWPTQLVGALTTMVELWLLERIRPAVKLYPGGLAALGSLGISLQLLILSYFRVDPTPFWHSMRSDAWGALVLLIICAGWGIAVFLPGIRNFLRTFIKLPSHEGVDTL